MSIQMWSKYSLELYNMLSTIAKHMDEMKSHISQILSISEQP